MFMASSRRSIRAKSSCCSFSISFQSNCMIQVSVGYMTEIGSKGERTVSAFCVCPQWKTSQKQKKVVVLLPGFFEKNHACVAYLGLHMNFRPNIFEILFVEWNIYYFASLISSSNSSSHLIHQQAKALLYFIPHLHLTSDSLFFDCHYDFWLKRRTRRRRRSDNFNHVYRGGLFLNFQCLAASGVHHLPIVHSVSKWNSHHSFTNYSQKQN